MPNLWNRIDIRLDPRAHLVPEDACYFARDYHPRGGWQANQLIFNFKMAANFRGQRRWYYRTQAVTQFANELATTLPQGAFVTFIPSSVPIDHEDYNNRFEDLFEVLGLLRPDLVLSRVFDCAGVHEAAHNGGTRNPERLQQQMVIRPADFGQRVVCIVDDVITSGGHFRCCKDQIREISPGSLVLGFFWGKTVFDTASPFPPIADDSF